MRSPAVEPGDPGDIVDGVKRTGPEGVYMLSGASGRRVRLTIGRSGSSTAPGTLCSLPNSSCAGNMMGSVLLRLHARRFDTASTLFSIQYGK